MQKNAALNNNYKYVFNFIDMFSKYTVSIPLKSKKKVEMRDALDTAVKKMESLSKFKIQLLASDNDGEFTSGIFNKYCDDHGIVHITTKSYSPLKHVEKANYNYR